MVFKKYIKRGERTYGPYLYENKRVNGRVVTSYIGKDNTRAKDKIFNRNNISLISIIGLLILILGFIYYLDIDKSLTGRAGSPPPPTSGDSCGNGILDNGEECDDGNIINGDGCDSNCKLEICGNGVIQSGEECDDGNTNNGDGCNNNCFSGQQGSQSAGSSITFEPKIAIPSGQTISISNDPLIMVSVISSTPDAEVLVSKTSQLGNVFAGELVKYETFMEIPKDSKVNEVIFSLPSGSQYFTLGGDSRASVSVTASSLIKENIFDLPKRASPVVIKINNPEAGNYKINFYLGSPVSFTESVDGKERLILKNPWDHSFKDVSTLVSIKKFGIRDSKGLDITSSDDRKVDYKVFDIDKDGIYDFVRLDTDISAKSEVIYDIAHRGIVNTLDLPKDDSITIPKIALEDIPLECKTGLSCSDGPCIADSSLVFSDEIAVKIKRTLCVSDNIKCFPIMSLQKAAKLQEVILI